MRKVFTLLISVALLLTACHKTDGIPPKETPSDAIPTASPISDHMVESDWWESCSVDQLPAQIGQSSVISGVKCRLSQTLPEQDIFLYSCTDGAGCGRLLRKGTVWDYFPRDSSLSLIQEIAPKLYWSDFDEDGTDELAVIEYRSPEAASLQIYEWDGSWTEYSFSPDLYEPILDQLLDVQISGANIRISCQNQYIDYQPGPADDGLAAPFSDHSGLLFFRISNKEITVVFGLGVKLGGEPRYIAQLSALIDYRNGTYDLRDCTLLQTGGV